MINCIAKLYEYCIDNCIYYRYNKNIVLIIVLIYAVGYIQVHAILHNSHYPFFSVVNYGANVQKIYDMKKFSYKKLVDSFTFRRACNDYFLTVHSIAIHSSFMYADYLPFYSYNYPYAVAYAAKTFLAAVGSSDTLPTLELYHDGKLYTWHIDRYNHIIFRVYRVVK